MFALICNRIDVLVSRHVLPRNKIRQFSNNSLINNIKKRYRFKMYIEYLHDFLSS